MYFALIKIDHFIKNQKNLIVNSLENLKNLLSKNALDKENKHINEDWHMQTHAHHQNHFKKSQDPYEEGWIEENLLYRGLNPPTPIDFQNDWIQLPHENYINISKHLIIQKVFDRYGYQDHPLALHFKELLESIYHFKYHKILSELKMDYEYFSPDIGPSMRESLSEEEILKKEQRFLRNFIHLMIRGNFNPLEKEQYLQSVSHKYLLDLPIDINWDIYDPKMIEKFIDDSNTEKGRTELHELTDVPHLEDYLNMPEIFENKILIFHRGLTRDFVKGSFTPQKIGVFVDRIEEMVLSPFQKLFTTIGTKTLDQGKKIARIRFFKEQKSMVDSDLQDSKQASTQPLDTEQKKEKSSVFLPIWLKRTSLNNQPIQLKNLFDETVMQEPIFQKMICLFRLYPYQHPPFLKTLLKKIPILNKFIKTPPQLKVDHTIYLKMFSNIPLADMEVVFPEIHIRMKPLDRFLLVILCLAGLSVGVMSTGHHTIWIVFSLIIGIAFKTILRFINMRRKYLLQMSQDIYRKNLDNYIGVIQYLVDNIEDQEFNESFLAYMVLLAQKRPMTESEVDVAVEELLHELFPKLEIDFEVDDALDKLSLKPGETLEDKKAKHRCFLHLVDLSEKRLDDGSVVYLYQAKSLEVCLQYMDAEWDQYFQYA
jgi:hypothetical protein